LPPYSSNSGERWSDRGSEQRQRLWPRRSPLDWNSAAFHLQASGAAAQALGLLQRGVVEIEPMTAEVMPLRCVACGLCVEVCPASAIELVEARPHQLVAEINPALCKGCGVCVAACPEQGRRACQGGAITLHGFTDQQLLAQLSWLLMPEMVVG